MIGISTPTATPLTPAEGRQAGLGGREDLLILHGVLERAREQHGPIDNPAARLKELQDRLGPRAL